MSRAACGTRDLYGKDLDIREYIFNIFQQSCTKRNAKRLDTPVFELYSTVKNIYGDEFDKNVYKFNSPDNDEELILRYDLTVPFARYVGSEGLKQFRRFQIGKVYRSDNPQIAKGRYREFYQCDFDIAGSDNGTGIYDYEIIDTLCETLIRIIGKEFKIRINDRNIIYEYIKSFSIDDDQIMQVSSTLDKLDKKSVGEILEELKQKLNLQPNNEEIIKTIANFINDIKADPLNVQKYISKETYTAFDNRMQMFEYYKDYILFDPLMVRGLDYYTGIIIEAYYDDLSVMPSAIAAGGRYDNLIGKFSNQNNIPAIGVSIGVERFSVILEKYQFNLPKQTKIYVATIGPDMLKTRLEYVTRLRRLGFHVVFSHQLNPKFGAQMKEVFDNECKYMIIIGPDELANNKLKIKNIDSHEEHAYEYDDLLNYLLSLHIADEY